MKANIINKPQAGFIERQLPDGVRSILHPLPKAPDIANKRKVHYNLTVGLLDNIGAERVIKYEVPMKNAISFIEQYSRIKIITDVFENKQTHDYFYWYDGNGVQVWDMLRDQLPLGMINDLPRGDAFLFLFKMFWRQPGRGGSTFGVPDGIPSPYPFGTRRPYSTIAADVAQYGLQPYQGFPSNATQLLVHEIVNGINCKFADPPYACTPMVGSSSWSAKYESERLLCLTDADYARIFSIEDNID